MYSLRPALFEHYRKALKCGAAPWCAGSGVLHAFQQRLRGTATVSRVGHETKWVLRWIPAKVHLAGERPSRSHRTRRKLTLSMGVATV